MKKIFTISLLIILVSAALGTWWTFGPSTTFTESKKAFYIEAGSSFTKVQRDLERLDFVKHNRTFKIISKLFKYNENIKPGRFVFEKNASIYTIFRTLRSGRQTPVNLVITKLRTKEDLAEKIAKSFECDSLAVITYLNSNDSLANYKLDSNTVMTAIIPNTYSILWNTSFPKIFKKLFYEQQKFWNVDRSKKAAALQLSKTQVYTLASIVEEETNMEEDKGKIAGVYINRMQKGMRLGADPTVKFAMKNFALKRIYQKHLSFPSPYNTYQVSGLPPGPICTPSQKTIDAVLNAAATNYLYFVAKPDFSGYSNFAETYTQHLIFAKAYQGALDTLMKKRSQ